MKTGETGLLAVLACCLTLNGCQTICSISPGTCGSLYNGDSPQSRIASIKWSPDGKRMVFSYRKGDFAPSTEYSLYIINIDGTKIKKLLEHHVDRSYYVIYQWTKNNKILTSDLVDLYDVDEQGMAKKIYSQPHDQVNGYYYQIESACHLSDAQYVMTQSYLPFPGVVNVLNTATGTVVPAKVIQPNSFLPFGSDKGSSTTVACLPSQNRVYIGQVNSSAAQNNLEAYFAIGKMMPETAEIEDTTLFKSFGPSYEHINDVAKLELLGADTKNNLFYSLRSNKGQLTPAVFSYNLESKETQEHENIKVLGDFAPDFQKVAFIDYDKTNRDFYLAISNVDGSEKKIIIKEQNLLKGTLRE